MIRIPKDNSCKECFDKVGFLKCFKICECKCKHEIDYPNTNLG